MRAAHAATDSFDTTLAGYVSRMLLALVLLGVFGYLATKYLPGRLGRRAQGQLRVIASLALGRETLHVVQIGPEVVAILVGKSAPTVLGRWPIDEWEDYEAATTRHDKDPA